MAWVSRTPKAYKNLAQGGGFAEPWVLVVKARSSEGAKESVEPRAIKAAQYSRMTITCDVAGFLPLLQSGPRLTLNTQGSAEPPPWAKFLYRLPTSPLVHNRSIHRQGLRRTSRRSQHSRVPIASNQPRKLFRASIRYLMHFSPITLVAAMPPCVLLRLFLSDGRRSFTVKMLLAVRHLRLSPDQ